MKRLLLLAAVAAMAGCNPFASLTQSQICPPGGVGLYISLFNQAQGADTIDFEVAIDNQLPKSISYTRAPGSDHETLEIDIDYQKNLYKTIYIGAVARGHGVKIASDAKSKVLTGSCANIQMLMDSGGEGCTRDQDCTSSSGLTQVCNLGACCTQLQTNTDMLSCPYTMF
jgi:hypothetical protein